MKIYNVKWKFVKKFTTAIYSLTWQPNCDMEEINTEGQTQVWWLESMRVYGHCWCVHEWCIFKRHIWVKSKVCGSPNLRGVLLTGKSYSGKKFSWVRSRTGNISTTDHYHVSHCVILAADFRWGVFLLGLKIKKSVNRWKSIDRLYKKTCIFIKNSLSWIFDFVHNFVGWKWLKIENIKRNT